MSRPLRGRSTSAERDRDPLKLAIAEMVVSAAVRALAAEYGVGEEKARRLLLRAVEVLMDNGLGG